MKYILIDLDGTITDPKLGITKSIQYALKAFNIPVQDLDSLCKFIGPPLRTSFMEEYGFDEVKTEEAIAKYREYFAVTGLYENVVYYGMEELLSKLKRAGKTLIVATSKPEIFAQRILDHFGLSKYFDGICGATLDHSRGTKEEVIRYALERHNIREHSQVVMVGDRLHDIEGAKSVGIASIGVLYGYGSKEELEEAGADRIAATVEELYEVIMDFSAHNC